MKGGRTGEVGVRGVLRIVVVLGALALFAPGTARANDCTITQPKSLEGTVATSITFANSTSQPLDVYWLDYGGVRVFFNSLGPFGAYTHPTWVTHPTVGTHRVTRSSLG